MATVRIGSPGVGLPYPSINSALISNYRSLAAGQKHLLPSGQYLLHLGPYTVLQVYDPVAQVWDVKSLPANGYIESDGVNYRLANLTGSLVGALVTTAGSGYSAASPPAVTVSAGGATLRAIVGGQISTTVTVATSGVGYNHQPNIVFPPPPAGGIQAAATAVISGGQITSIVVTNVGAGYTTAPTASVFADPQDTITTPAGLTAGLVTGFAATSVTAVVVTDPGTSEITAVPTLTIAPPTSGTTAVATAIPMFTVKSLTLTGAGSGYGNTQPFQAMAAGAFVAGTQAVTNPITGTGLFQPRAFMGYGTGLNGGLLTATGFVVSDGGLHQAVPAVAVINGGTGVPTLNAIATASVGGVTDTSFIQQI